MTAGLNNKKSGECTLIPILFSYKWPQIDILTGLVQQTVLCTQWISWFKILSCMTRI